MNLCALSFTLLYGYKYTNSSINDQLIGHSPKDKNDEIRTPSADIAEIRTGHHSQVIQIREQALIIAT